MDAGFPLQKPEKPSIELPLHEEEEQYHRIEEKKRQYNDNMTLLDRRIKTGRAERAVTMGPESDGDGNLQTGHDALMMAKENLQVPLPFLPHSWTLGPGLPA